MPQRRPLVIYLDKQQPGVAKRARVTQPGLGLLHQPRSITRHARRGSARPFHRLRRRLRRRGGLVPKFMKHRVSVLTLGVDDLERALRFYREGLGLRSEGIVGTEFDHGAVVFFPLQGGLMLALYPRKEIAWDAQVPQGPQSSTEFTVAHNVGNREEVDRVMEEAVRAGARLAKPAGPTFWGGYAGYFQDPDGHLWEIAWNPHLPSEDPL